MHRRSFAVGTAITAVLLSLFPSPAAVAACPGPTRPEKGFARKTNSSRADKGLNKLTIDPELSRAAKEHTREMAKKKTLEHTPNDVLAERVTNWTELGENVGVGQSVKSLHAAFMDSKPHRDNILYSKWKYIGIGVVKSDGKMWVTVLFEHSKNPGTTLSC